MVWRLARTVSEQMVVAQMWHKRGTSVVQKQNHPLSRAALAGSRVGEHTIGLRRWL